MGLRMYITVARENFAGRSGRKLLSVEKDYLMKWKALPEHIY